MDTSVKRFKYSAAKKALCVLLCAVTFISAAWLGTLTVLSAVYIHDSYSGERKDAALSDWTAGQEFFSAFRKDVFAIKNTVCYSGDMAEIRQNITKMKPEIISQATEKAKELKNRAAENKTEQATNVYSDGEDEYETELTTEYDYGETVDINITFYGETVGYLEVRADDDEQSLSKRFDDSVGDWANEAYFEISPFFNAVPSTELHYFAKLGDEESSGDKEYDEKAAYGAEYYFIVKDGKLEYGGINKETAESVFESLKSTDISTLTLGVYFNSSELKNTGLEALVNAGIGNEDVSYSQLYELHNKAVKMQNKTARNIITVLVLLVLSFVFGFEYFGITGKTDNESPAELKVYDSVPVEIGLALIAAVAAGLGYALISTFEAVNRVRLSLAMAYAFVGFVSVLWFCLFVFCASTVRYFRSERKFRKHFLVYWLSLAVWEIVKFCAKAASVVVTAFATAIKKVFGAVSGGVRKAGSHFFYKPKRFQRNVIVLVIFWFIANVILGLLLALAVANYSEWFAAMFIFIMIVGNAYVLFRVCRYIKNLDTIIDASSKHEDISVDINSLDLSLKTLAESMRYTNAELQSAINKAVKDERLRTELITNVSHDLKTPLTSIIVYVDLLSKSDIDDEKAKEYIAVLDEKGKKLKKLIDDLIEASKVTSGNVTINPTNINLSELCLQATVDAQPDFEKAGLELIVKSGEKQTVVFADGNKTNRIIENLLSNARKYSAKASRVYVSVNEEQDYGVFEIKNVSAAPLDITPAELTERFVRGDESRTGEGSGLGLSIAKDLCALQGGELILDIDGDLFKVTVKLLLVK